ncbi:DNA polymerase I [Arcanobacterium haemolyticum]|uniref:DNA polymerase I n=1 Tax=Arcanobacterium haemolyticum (strain ATCC 9345 / DSM 20595 / CCM 5947 / CCUG 17215 / LMG 16163 / NBRC 15585 / NCTC 8452 / 11018) TaxID=644284 RepID=D7BNX2_ARCHD|nr:DNA polymerase I [Arcanobacterium haemolyticum]ADH92621.1 DNA polymerase I [Arcanobacterium haemolyticum DSM 20595]
MTEKTMLLLDGHSMAFRSFFALPADSFRTAQGQYTNAVHGFINTLLRLINDYKPTHIAVAFDLPGGTFRTREYGEYKGGRAKTPEEFKGQIGVIQEVLNVMGISWLTVDDYEADDIVATLSARGEAEGMNVFIASGDKDSYQLVSDLTSVVYPMPRSQMLLLNPAGVEERTGVRPDQYSDLAALVGEKADNLPGVPGVGPKTAAKWLNQYGGLGQLLDHAEEIKGKAGQSLRDNIEQVRLNRVLNKLVRDLDIVPNLDQLVPMGVERQALHELFDTLDFTTLRTRVLAELPIREGSEDVVEEADKPEARDVTLWEGSCGAFLAEHAGPYAIAIEGNGKPGAGSVARFACAARDGYVFGGEPALISEEDSAAFSALLSDPNVGKIGHSMKVQIHAWLGEGYTLAGIVGDTEIDAYLLHPDQRTYDFTDLVQRYLAIDLGGGAQDTLGIGLDGEIVDDLAARAVATHDLRDAFARALETEEQSDALREMELRVCDVLARMEQRGIAVDADQLARLHADFDARVNQAATQAWEAIGDSSVNLSSPKQLQAVLFDQLGLPKTKKTKSGYTTNADALEQLLVKISMREDDQALAGQNFLTGLLAHRDAIKLRQSVEGLQRSLGDDQRIRTTYQQTVAATGRLSSTDPNLQNIHARTEEGQKIREVFVPGDGYDYLMTADYSQIEMRLMAHLSGDAELIVAFNAGADLHNYVASRVFGVAESEVTPAQRSKIKAMSYGLVYGLSAFGLSAQLKIPVPEAQNLMDGYFSRFGRVKEYLDGLVAQARKDGFTQTLLGRRRYLPELSSTNRQVRESAERMALNAPIQGSAADIIKIAMLNVERELAAAQLSSRVLLQVHDELVLEVAASEAEQVEAIVREQMGNAWELSVPLSVGVGIGRNWRDAAH